VLIVFTILLTRRGAEEQHDFHWTGALIALAVFGGLTWAIMLSGGLSLPAPALPHLTVRQIGELLMTDYVWPLQCVGLILTAALIGAMVLVMEEKR